MNILINAINLTKGGGVQVANSICIALKDFKQHSFFVVLPDVMDNVKNKIQAYSNVKVLPYDKSGKTKKDKLLLYLFGKDKYLDNIVSVFNIKCVLTIFGPTLWKPKCKHLCGFALSHLVMPESPYFKTMTLKERLQMWWNIQQWTLMFRRNSDYMYTENPLISKRVEKLFPNHKQIFTITNYYNQVFDDELSWVNHPLPNFDGFQLIDIASNYPHKNLKIIVDIAKILKKEYSSLDVRFILTIDKNEFIDIPEELSEYFLFIGKVDISECPSLYNQCDAVFQPTLLECFTATYPEAMRMQKPIITTDLEFSRGLCGDAAVYFDPLNARSATEAIVKVMQNDDYRNYLIEKGKERLMHFDTYSDRINKLISTIEKISVL